jgi:heme o synthase
VIKAYYYLTKPGIIYGNVLTATAGFFLATNRTLLNPFLLIATLLGTGCIIAASACVFNNYIDRDIDKKMIRTQKRALVTGKISEKNAIIFGIILGTLGIGILFLFVNVLTALVGIVGFIFYVFIYGYAKRTSDVGTLIGTIPGATPPLAGYTAVINQLDIAALLLFLILVFWQMPHFYAIAIYRLIDYKAANIPVLPLTKGLFLTKIHMCVYTLAFFVACVLLYVFGYTGRVYVSVMTIVCFYWLFLCSKGFYTHENTKWAKKVFQFSLIVILVFSLLLSTNALLS